MDERARSGDGKAAKELSTRAHAEQASLHAANRKAVEAIFKHRNPKGADELRCDLHGLHKVSGDSCAGGAEECKTQLVCGESAAL